MDDSRSEKHTHKMNIDHIKDENIFCLICEEQDYTEQNQIIFCDGCDVTVHQECYHVVNLGAKWYCQKCLALNDDRDQQINCQFCPEQYQILELVQINGQQQWAHSSCLKWNPFLVQNPQSYNLYTCEIDLQTGYKCRYCQKIDGFQLECQYKGCQEAFHIGCLKVNGGIMNKEAMECIHIYMKPYLKIQDEKLLFCVEHVEELLCKLDENQKSIIEEKYLKMRSERLHSYYVYNRNNKQAIDIKNETKTTRKQKNYEDMLFDEVVQLKQLKQAKIPIKDKKVKMQFKEYMTRKLNDQLHKLRDDFMRKNHNDLNADEDTYIQIDTQLSKKLFDKLVDINNLEEFDKYLVSYFIFNNMIRKPNNPEIYIRDDNSNYQYWKKMLDELGIKNGEQFSRFLNVLRLKKMNIVSRNNEKLQYEQDLQQQFEIQNNELIE
ncbi:unnamed protein product [Paramecium primaurelia]|uniref:Uncharacterized protein n=1 Tax=Paramecium primaurelia TaxID=5886 RepID=A0A8S1LM77_PARPR|nr:unnamed protein product [Paramecium primaurelia]